MSWYTDPQLFIELNSIRPSFTVWRIQKEYGSPVWAADFANTHLGRDLSSYIYDVVKFRDAFKSPSKYTNCRGWVITWDAQKAVGTWSSEEPNSPFWRLPGIAKKQSATELRSEKQALEETVSDLQATIAALKDELEKEKAAAGTNDEKQSLEKTILDLEADILSLDNEFVKQNDEKNVLIDDLSRERAEKQALEKKFPISAAKYSALKDDKNALEKKVAELEAENVVLGDMGKELTGDLDIWAHEAADVHNQLAQEKKDKLALEKTVLDLKSKLEQCGGGGGSTDEEPWLSSHTIPSSNWVPFEDLVPGVTRKSRPLDIRKRDDMPAFDEDYTTNVKASCFYRGMVNDRVVYPIVVVNFTELIPNGEKAKFDPNVWSLFNNAATVYAARNPFPAPIRH